MDEGVNHAVRDLARRQGIGINRIEDRELRVSVVCAFLGAPVLIWLVRRQPRGGGL